MASLGDCDLDAFDRSVTVYQNATYVLLAVTLISIPFRIGSRKAVRQQDTNKIFNIAMAYFTLAAIKAVGATLLISALYPGKWPSPLPTKNL